ncbi:oligosaccharide flippase family protein [Vibrio cyclitrophicus]
MSSNNLTVIAKKFLGVSSFQLISKILAMFVGVLLARVLGPDNFGEYTYILSIVTIISIPIISGLSQFIVKKIAAYINKNELSSVSLVISHALKYLFVSSTSIALLSFFLISTGITFSDVDSYFILIIATVFFKCVTLLIGSIVNSLGKPSKSVVINYILQPFCFIILLLACYQRIDLDVEISLSLFAASFIFSSVISILYLNYKWKFGTLKFSSHTQSLGWTKSILSLSLVMVVTTLNIELPIIALKYLSSSADVGFYRVALQLALLFSLPLVAINVIIGPKISHYYAIQDKKALQRELSSSVKVTFMFSLLPILLVTFFSRDIISLLFGSAYLESTIPLLILMVGQTINLLTGSVGLVYNMTGNERETIPFFIASLFFNILLLFLLIPSFGVTGASFAYSATMIMWNVSLALKLNKDYKIRTWLGG